MSTRSKSLYILGAVLGSILFVPVSCVGTAYVGNLVVERILETDVKIDELPAHFGVLLVRAGAPDDAIVLLGYAETGYDVRGPRDPKPCVFSATVGSEYTVHFELAADGEWKILEAQTNELCYAVDDELTFLIDRPEGRLEPASDDATLLAAA